MRHLPARVRTLVLLTVVIACSSGGSGNPIEPGPEPPGTANTAPVVTLSGDTTVDADRPISLTVQATDADGIARIVIAWGDGTADTLAVGGVTSHESTVTHNYGRVGTFQVEATATDSRSVTGRAVRSVTTLGGSLDIGLEHARGSAPLIARARVSVSPGLATSVLDGDVTTAHDLVPGEHQVSAEAVRSDCVIQGDAVRTVRIEVGSTARVDFSIACTFVPQERIVYNTLAPNGRDDGISSVRPDGSDRRRLTDLDDLAFPAWSPDGTRILAGFQSIWIMNHDGTEATSVGRGGRPAWSPDGRRIAFELNDDLAVADLDGRTYTNVVFLTGDGSSIDDEGPSWSPDGLTIVFHRGDVIHLVKADGSQLRALVPGVGAVWMPDGRRIVFVHTGLGQIASMRPDGTDVRVLTDLAGGAGHPDPSPNGDRIAFHSPRLSARARIWIMNADGTDPRVVEAIPTGAEHPNWGPP